jgi:hypothetical protein
MQFGNIWQLQVDFKLQIFNSKHFARDLNLGHKNLAIVAQSTCSSQ